MKEQFSALKIEALACALPSTIVATDAFEETFGKATIARMKEVTGITSRHLAGSTQTTADLATAAAQHLFTEKAIDPQQIDLLLFITQTPEAIAPATSALLQARLGLREDILTLDINQGCAGFMVGLLTAANFLQSRTLHRVLICGGDTLSRMTDPSDSATALLFGDAGFAATLLAEGETAEFLTGTSGAMDISIPCQDATFKMNGFEVFNFTMTRVPEQIKALLSETKTTPHDYAFLLLHQANAFIVKQVAKLTGFSTAQTPLAIEDTGNTSSASLPLLLAHVALQTQATHRVLLSAFGVGLTWISATLTCDFSAILQPIYLPEETSL